MIKKFVVIFCVCFLIISLSACDYYAHVETVHEANDEEVQSVFIEVERSNSWLIVYHRETKVMYAVSYSGYNMGTFTLLVEEDGTPMTYKE